MALKTKIRVLIVDDSMVFREAIRRGISQDPSLEVVAMASDPFMARDKLIEFEPDVMTLDVEMPKMNGIEFLQRLMPQYPIPVVVVSSVSESVLDALNAGAVDFVPKPDMSLGKSLDSLLNELIIKVKIASTAKVGHHKKTTSGEQMKGANLKSTSRTLIAIGASTGGTEAIYHVIRNFPKDMPATVIVQHMPPVFTKMYADRLNNSCTVEVREAQSGDRLLPGRVLIAPGDLHMKLVKMGSGYAVECFKGEKVNGHCPSVDVLFDSVAHHVGRNAVGVILTGMGCDGATGLLAMKQSGATTIGQDEQSSVVYGMPKVAYDIGAVDFRVGLGGVASKIYGIIGGRNS